jgi:hypothetical protein
MAVGMLTVAAVAVLFAGYSAEGRFPRYGVQSILAFLLLAAFFSLLSQSQKIRPLAAALAGLIMLGALMVAIPQLGSRVGRSDRDVTTTDLTADQRRNRVVDNRNL